MGRTVARLAADDPAFEVVGGLDRPGSASPRADQPGGGAGDSSLSAVATPDTAGPLLSRADVVIDFSAPEFIGQLLERYFIPPAGESGSPDAERQAAEGGGQGGQPIPALIVGTTGLGPEVEALLDEAARHVPVLTAANFSVGVNLLLALAERTASVLGPEFDIEIVEAHHRRKEDAPSGTALALGRAVAEGRAVDLEQVRRDGRSGRPGARPQGEIGFHAIRGGDVIGEHHVLFLGELERVELVHRASDRGLFAAGALRAARWIRGRSPGRYSMRDVLGF